MEKVVEIMLFSIPTYINLFFKKLSPVSVPFHNIFFKGKPMLSESKVYKKGGVRYLQCSWIKYWLVSYFKNNKKKKSFLLIWNIQEEGLE